MPELSIIVPFYNEEGSIVQTIEAVKTAGLENYELILIDDGSTDRSFELAKSAADSDDILLQHARNAGKSQAMQTALERASGEWVIVQDADLEYDPRQISRLLAVAKNGNTVVYGRRPTYWSRPSRWLFATGVLIVDLALLIVYRRWVRDHATCYKLIPSEIYRRVSFCSTGFEGCVELTAKLMRLRLDIKQVRIAYEPRGFAKGKKLTASYGLTAIRTVWRYRNWVG